MSEDVERNAGPAWQVGTDGREWCVVCRRERAEHTEAQVGQCWGQVLRHKRLTPIRQDGWAKE